MNSRLDALQAVVLRAKLRRLDGWNAAAPRGWPIGTTRSSPALAAVAPARASTATSHVWHLYVVRVADRDRVIAQLREGGVDTGIHYPTPIHLTPAYEWLDGRPGRLPGVGGGERGR